MTHPSATTRINGDYLLSDNPAIIGLMSSYTQGWTNNRAFTRYMVLSAITYVEGEACCYIEPMYPPLGSDQPIYYRFLIEEPKTVLAALLSCGITADYDSGEWHHFNLAILAGGDAEVARKIVTWCNQ